MTTAVTNQPVKPTNYFDKLDEASKLNANVVQPLTTELSERISKPLDILSAFVQGAILNNRLDEVRSCLTSNLEMYEGIGKGHEAAKAALAHFNQTLSEIPETFALPVEVRTHMEELDVMKAFTSATETCADGRKALKETTDKLAELVKNTHAFMESMKAPLNTVAYAVKTMEKKTGILDRLPSRGFYYFDEALVAFKTPAKPADATTTAAAQQPQEKELVAVNTASSSSSKQSETPKAKSAAAELAASLS